MFFIDGTFLTFLFLQLFYYENVAKWHTRIIKQQLKMIFLMLSNKDDKRYRPINRVPRQ